MSNDIIISLIVSLALTLILEVGFFLIVRSIKGKHDKKDLALVVMVNILTNPAVVLLYWLAILYTDINYAIIIAPLEISAVFIEGYIYKKRGRYFKHPYIFSIAANAFSFGIGVLTQIIIQGVSL